MTDVPLDGQVHGSFGESAWDGSCSTDVHYICCSVITILNPHAAMLLPVVALSLVSMVHGLCLTLKVSRSTAFHDLKIAEHGACSQQQSQQRYTICRDKVHAEAVQQSIPASQTILQQSMQHGI